MENDITEPIESTAAERLGIQERQAAFNTALLGDDPLGAIVRAHIYIEHEVIAFIESQVKERKALDAMKLDYDGRVQLAIALGLPQNLKPMLSCIGKLRNRFAHRLDAKLGKQEADGLKIAMGEDINVIKGSLASTDKNMGKPARKWTDLEPSDQIILMFIGIWSLLALINHHARKAKESGNADFAVYRKP